MPMVRAYGQTEMKYNTNAEISRFWFSLQKETILSFTQHKPLQRTQKFASFLFPWSSSLHLLFHTSSISLFSITFWPAKKLIVAKMCVQARLFTDFVT